MIPNRSETVVKLAEHLEFFHLGLQVCFDSNFKFFVDDLLIIFSLHVLSLLLTLVDVLVHFFVELPLLITSILIHRFARALITPVVMDKIKEFGYFVVPFLLLLVSQIFKHIINDIYYKFAVNSRSKKNLKILIK